METISCLSCKAVNSFSNEKCEQCEESLSAAKLQHTIDELRKTTEKLHTLAPPGPSFSTYNGFGTSLLDYCLRPDGKYEATRWVTALFLPIVPLSAYVVEPESQEFGHGGATSNFRIVEKVQLSAARVLRTYLVAIVGLLPIITGFIYSREVNRTLGGPLAFVAMLVAVAWAIYLVFFRLKNDGKAYKSNGVSEG